MNSRERVLCSLNHVQPDRVPVDLQYTPEIAQILLRHFKTKDIEDVWKGLEVDCRCRRDHIFSLHMGVC